MARESINAGLHTYGDSLITHPTVPGPNNRVERYIMKSKAVRTLRNEFSTAREKL
jgi:hypothetical protein